MTDHLLPTDAGAFEKGVAGAVGRLSAILAPLDTLKRPAAVPEAFLPFLAWEVSTDVWSADWEDWRKRRAAARAIALHRLKGTLPAIEGYLDLLGAHLVDVVIPPQGAFLLRGQTEEQRREFLERFAQLRIHPYQIRGPGEVGAVYVGALFAGHGFIRPNRAAVRYGRRAFIRDGQTETSVRWGTHLQTDANGVAIPVEQVTIPARARPSQAFVGRMFVGRMFAEALARESRILTIEVNRNLGARGAPLIPSATGSLSVLSYTPDRVYDRGTAQPGTMFVGLTAGRHITGNRAAVRIYDRYYLFDPARVPEQRRRGAGFFVGHSRVELTPFRAELRVSFPGRRLGRPLFAGGFPTRSFISEPVGRMARVAAAVRSAQALRDKVVFTTQCHHPVRFEDAPPIDGSHAFGQQVAIRP